MKRIREKRVFSLLISIINTFLLLVLLVLLSCPFVLLENKERKKRKGTKKVLFCFVALSVTVIAVVESCLFLLYFVVVTIVVGLVS